MAKWTITMNRSLGPQQHNVKSSHLTGFLLK